MRVLPSCYYHGFRLQLKAGYRGPLLTIKRLIRIYLYEPFTFFVQTLHLKPKRSSRGRRRMDHEGVYREIVRQVLAGEADYLNDVTYDPLVIISRSSCQAYPGNFFLLAT
ncbi:hypothetical protein MGLY_27420 [Neomoorella glycerini]|uniref:Uncharacterized protein n=1 Tax=Neomoorella glycerini TaxID=55779 RepID=A0A6I5ZUM4_9FIRM|nr:hypothetical protein MGLY_27420 [Moorella glycerini]